MKFQNYCNKVVKITFSDRTVKYHQFKDLRDYKIFMGTLTLFNDVKYVDVYDHTCTKLVALERRQKMAVDLEARRPFPMFSTASIGRKGKISHGKVCNNPRNITKASRSSKK